eukprot:g4302.t1
MLYMQVEYKRLVSELKETDGNLDEQRRVIHDLRNLIEEMMTLGILSKKQNVFSNQSHLINLTAVVRSGGKDEINAMPSLSCYVRNRQIGIGCGAASSASTPHIRWLKQKILYCGKKDISTSQVSAEDLPTSFECSTFMCRNEFYEEVPPFCSYFSTKALDGNALCVSDEDGFVEIFDSRRKNAGFVSEDDVDNVAKYPRHRWLAHANAIFDLAWADNDSKVVTGSGDQTARLFDVQTGRLLLTFEGHNGSVKAVRPNPMNPHIFVTGARDGHMMLWDSRTRSRVPGVNRRRDRGRVIGKVESVEHENDLVLDFRSVYTHCESNLHTDDINDLISYNIFRAANCHVLPTFKKKMYQGLEQDSKAAVTSVVFAGDGNSIITGGAASGTIKLWDMRRLRGTKHKKMNFVDKYTPPVGKGRPYGVSSLALDSNSSNLLVNYTNGKINLFKFLPQDPCFKNYTKTGKGKGRPCCGYAHGCTKHGTSFVCLPHFYSAKGRKSESFYVKACFSPDGSQILAGSCGRSAYIWNVVGPNQRNQNYNFDTDPYNVQPTCLLNDAFAEVTCVDWGRLNNRIVTTSDDARVRVYDLYQHWRNTEDKRREENNDFRQSLKYERSFLNCERNLERSFSFLRRVQSLNGISSSHHHHHFDLDDKDPRFPSWDENGNLLRATESICNGFFVGDDIENTKFLETERTERPAASFFIQNEDENAALKDSKFKIQTTFHWPGRNDRKVNHASMFPPSDSFGFEIKEVELTNSTTIDQIFDTRKSKKKKKRLLENNASGKIFKKQRTLRDLWNFT